MIGYGGFGGFGDLFKRLACEESGFTRKSRKWGFGAAVGLKQTPQTPQTPQAAKRRPVPTPIRAHARARLQGRRVMDMRIPAEQGVTAVALPNGRVATVLVDILERKEARGWTKALRYGVKSTKAVPEKGSK